MPRESRKVCIGQPHHVTQRGNGRQQVFFDEQDHLSYLNLLKIQSRKHKLSLNALCLMPNHIHLIATPHAKNSLAKGVGVTDFMFANYFNAKYSGSGHLWQGRFFSCPLEGEHSWKAIKYVELNPVRANLCKVATDYRWSSAKVHINGFDPTEYFDLTAWSQEFNGKSWQEILGEPSDEDFNAELRERTLKFGN